MAETYGEVLAIAGPLAPDADARRVALLSLMRDAHRGEFDPFASRLRALAAVYGVMCATPRRSAEGAAS